MKQPRLCIMPLSEALQAEAEEFGATHVVGVITPAGLVAALSGAAQVPEALESLQALGRIMASGKAPTKPAASAPAAQATATPAPASTGKKRGRKSKAEKEAEAAAEAKRKAEDEADTASRNAREDRRRAHLDAGGTQESFIEAEKNREPSLPGVDISPTKPEASSPSSGGNGAAPADPLEPQGKVPRGVMVFQRKRDKRIGYMKGHERVFLSYLSENDMKDEFPSLLDLAEMGEGSFRPVYAGNVVATAPVYIQCPESEMLELWKGYDRISERAKADAYVAEHPNTHILEMRD